MSMGVTYFCKYSYNAILSINKDTSSDTRTITFSEEEK